MAIDDFEENIEFLKERWNDKIIVNFLEKTKTVIDLIKRSIKHTFNLLQCMVRRQA